MWMVKTSKFCKFCNKHFELDEMALGREQLPNGVGERIFRTCPICGKEIEDVVVNDNKK